MKDNAREGAASVGWSCDIMYLAREKEVKMRIRKSLPTPKPGDTFGKWTVLRSAGNTDRSGKTVNSPTWHVRCECGYETINQTASLYYETSTQCMRCRGHSQMNWKVGDQVGGTTIIGHIKRRREYAWVCECGAAGTDSVTAISKRKMHAGCKLWTRVKLTPTKTRYTRATNGHIGAADVAGPRNRDRAPVLIPVPRQRPPDDPPVANPAAIGVFIRRFREKLGKEPA